MEVLQNIIKKTSKKYGISRAQLLNTSNFHYTTARREVAYLAITTGFSFADLERETKVSRTTWRLAYKAYTPDVNLRQVRKAIRNEKNDNKLEQQDLEEAKAKAKEFSDDKPRVKKVLGFVITEREEIRYKHAILSAKKFMRNYGKGAELPDRPYGRIVRYSSWYNG